MGTCATVCSNPNKKQAEVNIESLQNDKMKIKITTHRYSQQPNFSKIIFLQTRIKRFFKKKKNRGILKKERSRYEYKKYKCKHKFKRKYGQTYKRKY